MTDGSAVLLLLRMIVSLAAVLGLLVVVARAVQRRQGGRPRGRRPAKTIEVVGRQSLSRGTSVQVVRVGELSLVLGVSDAGVRLLTQLPGDEATLGHGADAASDPPEFEAYVEAAAAAGEDGGAQGQLAPATRAARRGQPDSQLQTHHLTRAAARQADQVAQVIAEALTRSGRRRG